MEILAIIPARGGSKGLPRKNILSLYGKPLIAHSICAALDSKYINRVIVSTEDEEIARIARAYGAQIPFMRPMELAGDKTSGMEPILHTLEKLSEYERYYPDITVLLQPTSPLRTVKHIDDAVTLFLDHMQEFDSLISVTPLEHPVLWNKVMYVDGKLEDDIQHEHKKAQNRQDILEIYRLNGAIYIAKTDSLMQAKDFEMERTMGYRMEIKDSVDIDTQLDFEWAEFLMKKREINGYL